MTITKKEVGLGVIDKDGGAYQWVGKRVPRIDAPGKVTGQLKYMTDMDFPNMVWGQVLRAKYPHARIRNIDTTRAKAYPGVVAVLTYVDIPGLNGFGIITPDQPVLCFDKVRCTSDAVALVAAETKEIAQEAVGLIQVEYEILPTLTDPLVAIAETRVKIHEQGNVYSTVDIVNGDVESAFLEADIIVENTFYSPRQMHAFIETEGGWGVLEKDGTLTIRCPAQYGYRDRMQIARALAWNPARINVISSPLGGAFGGKDEITVQIYLALLALHTGGRPVKIHYSREESVIAGIKRHPFRVDMKTAAKKDGTLLANWVRAYADTGAYVSLGGEVVSLAIEHSCGPYSIPNVDLKGYCVYTNNGISGAFRGFGVNQVCMAIETHIDMIALQASLDFVEIRKKNVFRQGGLSSMGHRVMSSVGSYKTLEIAEDCELWVNREKHKREASEPWKKRGVAIATTLHGVGMGVGVPDYGAATIELLKTGKFRVGIGCEEMGTGNGTVYVQAAAECLKCDLLDITIIQGDTMQTIDGGTITASRSTYTGGRAIAIAAGNMIALLIQGAADMLEVSPSCLTSGDGKVTVTAGNLVGESVTYGQIYEYLFQTRAVTKVEGHFLLPKEKVSMGHGIPHHIYGYLTHVVMVEVDTLTGETEVLRVVSIPDAGRVMNPQGLEGQAEGGAVMGIGYTLYEDTIIEDGYHQTTSFANYILPTFKEAPVIETFPVEELEESNPFGAKGIAEVVMIPIIPAITSAIYDAVGIRIKHLPATPERIYTALKEARAKTVEP